MSGIVLDASAVLAILLDEPGADVVERHLPRSYISVVNWSEAIVKQREYGAPAEVVLRRLEELNLNLVSFNAAMAREAGLMASATRKFGLSLGDRACLATGIVLGKPVLSGDRRWAVLDIGVKVQLFR